jgi:hypothetical protein
MARAKNTQLVNTAGVPQADLCPCGGELDCAADKAHGVCRACRVDAHRKTRRRAPDPQPDGLFDDEPSTLFDPPPWSGRMFVPVDGWPERSEFGR